MRTVWKYKFDLKRMASETTDRQTFEMPSGSYPLYVNIQNDDLCLWVQVKEDNPIVKRTFCIVGTGRKIPDDVHVSKYIGTVLQDIFVWHIFEIG